MRLAALQCGSSHGVCRTFVAAVLLSGGRAKAARDLLSHGQRVGGGRSQVAQFKATVLLLPNGSDRVTSAPVQPWESEKKVEDEEVLKLLATSLKKSKSSKKTAKKKAGSRRSRYVTGDQHYCVVQAVVDAAVLQPQTTSTWTPHRIQRYSNLRPQF